MLCKCTFLLGELVPIPTFLLNDQESLADAYVIVALAPSTVIPAPLAAVAFAAPLANVILRSSTSNVVLLMVVVVPSTCRLPATINVPVLSPTAAGSIVKVAGPAI